MKVIITKIDFFLIFMQLLLQNCTNMAPFMQALYNVIISVSRLHRTSVVYAGGGSRSYFKS